MAELKRGAEISLPPFLPIMIKYISPLFLLVIFGLWCKQEMPGMINAIFTIPEDGPPVVLFSLALIVIVAVFFIMIVTMANRRWDKEENK